MTPNTKRASHDAIQTLANVTSTIVAVAALIYSSITYQNTVHSDSENQARKEWSEYLFMTSQSPEFSVDIGIGMGLSQKELLRHSAYQRRMFYYMDSVLRYDPSTEWKSIVLNELKIQRVVMCIVHSINGKGVDVSEYWKEFQSVFSEFLKQCNGIVRPD